MLVIVNYHCGNLGSIRNMLAKIGAGEVRVSDDRADIAAADKLILPGVGHFDTGMGSLRSLGLEPVLREAALERRIPVLGICLGMQLLFPDSEEGSEPGLGLVPGRIVRFRTAEAPGLKVPHMGWNTVEPTPGSRMFGRPEEEISFYFVHSYHAECDDPAHVAGWTRHGYDFASAVECANIWGTQFHPEKSHRYGMRLLQHFLEQ
ncbi:MAG: imidazole glycerol phosphate synthase subunit HisH [Desulfovibrionaceae bacterium]